MSERPVIEVRIAGTRTFRSREARFGDVLRLRLDNPWNRRWLYIAYDVNRDRNTLMVLTGEHRGTTMVHFPSASISSGFVVIEEGPEE